MILGFLLVKNPNRALNKNKDFAKKVLIQIFVFRGKDVRIKLLKNDNFMDKKLTFNTLNNCKDKILK